MALLFLGTLAEHPVFGSQSGFFGYAEEWDRLCAGSRSCLERQCTKRKGYVCMPWAFWDGVWRWVSAAQLSSIERNPTKVP